jgi:hypothetical protein
MSKIKPISNSAEELADIARIEASDLLIADSADLMRDIFLDDRARYLKGATDDRDLREAALRQYIREWDAHVMEGDYVAVTIAPAFVADRYPELDREACEEVASAAALDLFLNNSDTTDLVVDYMDEAVQLHNASGLDEPEARMASEEPSAPAPPKEPGAPAPPKEPGVERLQVGSLTFVATAAGSLQTSDGETLYTKPTLSVVSERGCEATSSLALVMSDIMNDRSAELPVSSQPFALLDRYEGRQWLSDAAEKFLPGYLELRQAGLDNSQIFPSEDMPKSDWVEVTHDQMRAISEATEQPRFNFYELLVGRYMARPDGPVSGHQPAFWVLENSSGTPYSARYETFSCAEAWLCDKATGENELAVADKMISEGRDAFQSSKLGADEFGDAWHELMGCGTFYAPDSGLLVNAYTGDHDEPTVELLWYPRGSVLDDAASGREHVTDLIYADHMLTVPFDNAHADDLVGIASLCALGLKQGDVIQTSEIATMAEFVRARQGAAEKTTPAPQRPTHARGL